MTEAPQPTTTTITTMPYGYKFTYDYQSLLYCPSCGKQEVWVERGEGDYYLGPTYVCVGCSIEFNLNLDALGKGILAALIQTKLAEEP